MFVNKVGLPVQGVDGNANLAQCVIEQHELAFAVQLNCVNFLEAVKSFFATFKTTLLSELRTKSSVEK